MNMYRLRPKWTVAAPVLPPLRVVATHELLGNPALFFRELVAAGRWAVEEELAAHSPLELGQVLFFGV
jgi:hypothetical protein